MLHKLLGSIGLCLPTKLEVFSHYFLKYFFCILFFLLSFHDWQQVSELLSLSLRFCTHSSVNIPIFLLFMLDHFNCSIIKFTARVSAIFILIISPSSEFSTLVIMFFPYKVSTSFLSISSIYLLRLSIFLLKHFMMASLKYLVDNSNICVISMSVPIITLWICYYDTLNT